MKLRNMFVSMCLVVIATSLYAAGLDSVSSQGIIQKVGTLLAAIGGIFAVLGLMYALLWGGWLMFNSDARAPQVFKNGMIGALISGSVYGLANWVSNFLK